MSSPVSLAPPRRTALSAALVRVATIVVCAVLPAISVAYVWGDVVAGSDIAPDFSYYYSTAQDLLDGEGIYPASDEDFDIASGFVLEYVYPPLTALVVTPFTAVSLDVASPVFCVLLFILFIASLALVGVRDWRCYGLALVWPPALDAVETGNVTIPLMLTAALAWRFRDRALVTGASLGVGLALKLLLWPVAIWLLATRRWRASFWTVGVASALVVVSWAIVRFDGIGEYPDLLRRLTKVMERESYSVYALGLDLGLPSEVARAAWVALAAGLLAGVVVLARRGDERGAFALALAAAVACSPIVWIHYFTLVLLAIAVVHPKLGAAWFVGVPMQLIVTSGAYNGSTFQTAAVLALAALAIALALRGPLLRPSDRMLTRVTPAAESP